MTSDLLVELSKMLKPMSGRELARRAGRSQPGAQRVIDRLVDQGLILEERIGSTHIYRLNREHLAAEPLVSLSRLRSLFFEAVTEKVSSWTIPPAHVSIFGSTARGDGTSASDVDTFVIRPADIDIENEAWRHQLTDLSDFIEKATGNSTSLVEVSELEFRRMRNAENPLVGEVQADGVIVGGNKLSRLI